MGRRRIAASTTSISVATTDSPAAHTESCTVTQDDDGICVGYYSYQDKKNPANSYSSCSNDIDT